jgi:hypothetical protein
MARGLGLARAYANRRFTALFAMLLLTISGHGLLGTVLPVSNLMEWLLGLCVVAAVLSVPGGALRWVLGAAAVGLLVARFVQPLLEHPAPTLVSQSLLAVTCILTAGVAVRRALAAGPVDAEHISAALAAYMLVGLAFGVVYFLIESALPGSFSTGPGGALTPPRAIYFSFVTQTTLGYGDIVPVGERAQGLVVAQAVGGQMYLAVLVARLVSLYSSQESR